MRIRTAGGEEKMELDFLCAKKNGRCHREEYVELESSGKEKNANRFRITWRRSVEIKGDGLGEGGERSGL